MRISWSSDSIGYEFPSRSLAELRESAQEAERVRLSPGTAGLLNGYGAAQQTAHSASVSFSTRTVAGPVVEDQALASGLFEEQTLERVVELQGEVHQEVPLRTSGPIQEPSAGSQVAESGSSSGKEFFHSAGRTTPQDGPQVAQLSQDPRQPQLFGQEAVLRWAQMEREAPLIYGGGGVSHSGAARSDSSGFSAGEIQAEVHRQLELVRREHTAQLRALAAENEVLRNRAVAAEGRRPPESVVLSLGNQAAKVMGWFGLGQGAFSSFVPESPSTPNPQPLPGVGAQPGQVPMPGALPGVQTGQVPRPRALPQASGAQLGQVPMLNALPQASGAQLGQVPMPGAQLGQVPMPSALPQASGYMPSALPQASGPMPGALPQASGHTPGALPQASGHTPGALPQASGHTPGALPQASGYMPGALPQASGPQSGHTPGALLQASGGQEADGLSSSQAGAPQQWPWQGLMQKALDASGLNQATGTQGLSPDAAGILAGIQALLAQQGQ